MSRRRAHVFLTTGKELRETLRDRRTVAVMVLFPLVVYPLLSLLVAQVAANKARQQEARRARVAVTGEPGAAADVAARLAGKPDQFTVEKQGTRADVEAGRLDALVVLASKPPVTEAEILFDATRDESREAEERLSTLLGRVLPEGCQARFSAVKRDLASGTRLGGYLLSKALPLTLVLMVVLGAFYPAIDVTAGERERGTLETSLSAPIRRYDLLLGKVFAVALLASLTGILNLVSMSMTLIHAMRIAAPEAVLPVPWSRAAAATLVVFPAAFLFGAAFVAVGSLARGFKEAQNVLMPVYLLAIAPALIGAVGEYPLAGSAALVPAMNVTLLARDLILGRADLTQALVVLGSTALYGALTLAVAARIYASEAFLSPGRQLVRAAFGGRGGGAEVTPAEAVGLWAVAFILLYFVFVPMQRGHLVRGLLVSQWGGMLGLVLVFARLTGRRVPDVLGLRTPAWQALAGAALVGLGAWATVAVLVDKLVPVPKEVLEQLRRTLAPTDGSRGLALNLALLAVTPAICEEALFRGPILRGLATRLSPAAAVVVTGVLFGIFHLDLYRLLPSATLGVLLSFIALRSGSIIPSVVAHFLNNAVLLTLATTKLDQRLGAVGPAATAALVGASVAMTALGLWLVQRSGPDRQM